MGNLKLDAAIMAAEQARADLEALLHSQASERDQHAQDATNYNLALTSAVPAMRRVLEYGLTAENRRLLRSAYRIGAAQLGWDHE